MPAPAGGPGAVPPEALRLFPAYAAEDLQLDRAAPFLLARLLEDGDSADLSWLCRRLPEAEIAAWLARSGGRQLSRRSRAFWTLLVGPPASSPAPGAPDLWPL